MSSGPRLWAADFVIVQIPVNEPANTLFDGCGWLESDVPGEVVYVRKCGRYIAGLHRQKALVRLPAETILNHLDQVQQLDRVVVADIVEPVGGLAGGRVRLVSVPMRIGRSDTVGHPDDALDDIINVSEIP